ncbi:MAG: hypothetical protein HDT39_17335 [Lachnospiraceae bacterium]|nr:hypothetical protein [Lachnospiraceae bacterium]
MTMNNNDEFVQNFDIVDTEPKPGKSKKKPIIIGGIVILCIIAAVSVFIYIKARMSPSERLIEGYTELFNVSDNYIADKLDIDKISESSKSTKNVEFAIDSYPSEPTIEGLGINSIISKNENKKKLENITGITYCGTAVMSSDIYVKNNTLYITVPSLFDDVLKIDLSKIEELKDSSYILKQIPDEFYKNFDMSAFEDIWNTDREKFSPITIADYIKRTSPEEWKNISDGIKITETENRNEIKLSVSGKSIKLFLNKSVEVITENDGFNQYFEHIRSKYNGNYSIDDIHQSLKSMVSILSLFLSDGIDIYTTLNSDNQITSIKSENNFSFMGIKLNASTNVDFKGAKNPKDEYYGSLTLGYNGENLIFNFSKSHTSTDHNKKISLKNTYNISYNDESIINMEISSDYEKMQSDRNAFWAFLGFGKSSDTIDNILIKYKSSVNVTSGFFTMDIEAAGDISDVSKGKSFTFNADTIKISLNSNEIISMSGSYSITTKVSSIAKPDGDTRDLLKMDEKDFRKLDSQINENLEKLYKSYSELKE